MGETRVRGQWWPLAALVLAAIAVALLSRHLLFHAYSWNRDEPVYLWQVEGLRAGLLTTPTGGFPTLFHPWLAGVRDHSFFSQYTLGWPLVLYAADTAVGSPDGALALGAALAVGGTFTLARELTNDPRVAVVAGAGMLVSPILVIQSGVYLGYLFTLGLGLLFATAVAAGLRTGRWGRLVVAGVVVGWIFMTRPFDAVLWVLAVVGATATLHRRALGRVVRALVPVGVGFLPLFVATLAYNRHVTGSLTQFPITAADPLDTFGFGHRRIMPTFGVADYTVTQAIRSSGKQAALLPIFVAGGYVLAVLALYGLWRARREAWIRVPLAVSLAFPIGYLFFWGMFVSSPTMPLSGPIYYIPVYATFLIVGAVELVRLWSTRRGFAIALVVVMAAVTIPVGVNRVAVNRSISRSQLPWKRSSASVPAHSLVFVWRADYLLFLNPFSANSPRLDGSVLWAVDRGAGDFRLLDAYPDRTAYLQRTSNPSASAVPDDHPETPEVTLTRLRVVRAPALRLEVTLGRPLAAGEHLYVEARGRVRDWPAADGAITGADFTVQASAGPPGTRPSNELGLGSGTGTISIGVGRGATAASAAHDPDARQDLHYRVRGSRIELLRPFETFRRDRSGPQARWLADPPGLPSPVAPVTVPVPLRKQ